MKATKAVMSAFTIALLCCILSPVQRPSAKPLPDSLPGEDARQSLEKAAAAGDASERTKNAVIIQHEQTQDNPSHGSAEAKYRDQQSVPLCDT
jgi:hypothetical protein